MIDGQYTQFIIHFMHFILFFIVVLDMYSLVGRHTCRDVAINIGNIRVVWGSLKFIIIRLLVAVFIAWTFVEPSIRRSDPYICTLVYFFTILHVYGKANHGR